VALPKLNAGVACHNGVCALLQTNKLEGMPGRTLMEAFEQKVNAVLNKARDDAGEAGASAPRSGVCVYAQVCMCLQAGSGVGAYVWACMCLQTESGVCVCVYVLLCMCLQTVSEG
jgi:hypothetical protein